MKFNFDKLKEYKMYHILMPICLAVCKTKMKVQYIGKEKMCIRDSRYVESLSSYARMFLGQMEKPNVDYIDGLSPACLLYTSR